TVRACAARSEGATRVNQWLTPRNSEAGSNLADMGRCAVHDHHAPVSAGWSTPKPSSSNGGEATLNACGVGVAMLPGYSWAPPWPIDCLVNVGTIRWSPSDCPSGAGAAGPLAADGPR